ncbi:hypothetical protein FB451DRAFT_1359283 [Mycena latifolia]|nr:hypothetical protein FB451DRAFT_1359283 [Mycena latifolia]
MRQRGAGTIEQSRLLFVRPEIMEQLQAFGSDRARGHQETRAASELLGLRNKETRNKIREPSVRAQGTWKPLGKNTLMSYQKRFHWQKNGRTSSDSSESRIRSWPQCIAVEVDLQIQRGLGLDQGMKRRYRLELSEGLPESQARDDGSRARRPRKLYTAPGPRRAPQVLPIHAQIIRGPNAKARAGAPPQRVGAPRAVAREGGQVSGDEISPNQGTGRKRRPAVESKRDRRANDIAALRGHSTLWCKEASVLVISRS